MTMKLPAPARAAKQRTGIARAHSARRHILANVQPPTYPRGWTAEPDPEWAAYDRSVRKAATLIAPLGMTANYAYWRTLATLFRGEALDTEYRTHVIPAIKTRAERHRARGIRNARHGR